MTIRVMTVLVLAVLLCGGCEKAPRSGQGSGNEQTRSQGGAGSDRQQGRSEGESAGQQRNQPEGEASGQQGPTEGEKLKIRFDAIHGLVVELIRRRELEAAEIGIERLEELRGEVAEAQGEQIDSLRAALAAARGIPAEFNEP